MDNILPEIVNLNITKMQKQFAYSLNIAEILSQQNFLSKLQTVASSETYLYHRCLRFFIK